MYSWFLFLEITSNKSLFIEKIEIEFKIGFKAFSYQSPFIKEKEIFNAVLIANEAADIGNGDWNWLRD